MIFLSISEGSILKVSGLISTKSILAPQYNAQFADATKLVYEVHTQSSLFIPMAIHAMCNALVALFTAIAYGTLTSLHISDSNSCTYGSREGKG